MTRMIKRLNQLKLGETGSKIVKSRNGTRLITYKRIATKGFPQYKTIRNVAA